MNSMPHPSTDKPLILVTGSSGLIGEKTIEAFKERHQVVGLDVKPPQDEPQGWDWIECDLTDENGVADALRQVRSKYGNRIASVIHLAAYYDFSGEPSPLYQELTVEGTRRLLKKLQEFQVEQFVFSSSLLVMKPVSVGQWLTEQSEAQAEWEYPQSKLEAEEVMRKEHGSIPIVIARIAGVYNEDCNSLPIAQQIKRIYEKELESHFFPGNREHGQAFIHLDDLIDFFQRVVEQRSQLEPVELFLVAEPDVMTYEELQDAFGQELHGKEWTTLRIPKAVAKAGAWVQNKMGDEEETFIKPWMVDLADAHYPVDIGRARYRLQWEPKHRLRDTVGQMAQQLKANPVAWYQQNGLPLPDALKDDQ